MNKRLNDLIDLLDIERIEVNLFLEVEAQLIDGKEFLEVKLLGKR